MSRSGSKEAIGKSPEHRDRWQSWKFQEDRDHRRQIPRPSRQMDKLGQESTKRKIQRARRSSRSRRVSSSLRQWVTWLQSCVFMKSVFVFDLGFNVVSERLHMLKSLFVSAYVQRVFLFVPIARNMYHLVTEVCSFHTYESELELNFLSNSKCVRISVFGFVQVQKLESSRLAFLTLWCGSGRTIVKRVRRIHEAGTDVCPLFKTH